MGDPGEDRQAPTGEGRPPGPATPVALPADAASARRSHEELLRRRERLAGEVAEQHWDLGGLAYEMAIRDHIRPDVLVRRAALLQERDAELAEVQRRLAADARVDRKSTRLNSSHANISYA